ncbi:hypothetical protein KY290_024997 [Solanum tuberosum]|uniref:Potassium channel n=1 Tax=Solanum tuberosum TaxID=4113 RepID=A0ABQ7US96_SOLTU|nr:hypothetical protein KY290_024997 [Solanum tuberosum]
MNVLPKAMRSSISHYLFLPIVQNVSLFRGVSRDLLFQLVLEMDVEYYPSKEDVILQNESQIDFYIIVSGALDILVDSDGREQIIGKAVARESFGEISVLLGRPQPYAVTTTEISKILCPSRKTFLNILHDNQEDEQIIMRNHFQKKGGKMINSTQNMEETKASMRSHVVLIQSQQGELTMIGDLAGPDYKLEFRTIGKRLNFSEKQSRSGIWGLEENHLSLLPQNRFLFGWP